MRQPSLFDNNVAVSPSRPLKGYIAVPVSHALSLTQPWATLVALSLKRWETRSWSTRFRGRTLIHAAKGFPAWAKEQLEYPVFRDALASFGITHAAQLPIGKIIGAVEIIGCEPTRIVREHISQQERAFGDYDDGRFAFEMRNAVQFKEPIEARGSLGFWKVPPEIVASLSGEAI